MMCIASFFKSFLEFFNFAFKTMYINSHVGGKYTVVLSTMHPNNSMDFTKTLVPSFYTLITSTSLFSRIFYYVIMSFHYLLNFAHFSLTI